MADTDLDNAFLNANVAPQPQAPTPTQTQPTYGDYTPQQTKQLLGIIQDTNSSNDAAVGKFNAWHKSQGIGTPTNSDEIVNYYRNPKNKNQLFDTRYNLTPGQAPQVVQPNEVVLGNDTSDYKGIERSFNAAPSRTLAEQFLDSAGTAFSQAGDGINAMILRGTADARADDVIRHYASDHNLSPQQLDDMLTQSRKSRALEVKNQRSLNDQQWQNDATQNPGIIPAIGRDVASFAGGMVGDVNPTYFVAPAIKPIQVGLEALAPIAGRVITPLAEKIISSIAPSVSRMAGQGAVNATTDVVSQGDEIARGIKDNYSPLQTAGAFGTGALFQGGMEGIAHAYPHIANWLSNKPAESGSVPVDTVKDLPQPQLSQLDQDLQVLSSKGLNSSHFNTVDDIHNAANTIRQNNPDLTQNAIPDNNVIHTPTGDPVPVNQKLTDTQSAQVDRLPYDLQSSQTEHAILPTEDPGIPQQSRAGNINLDKITGNDSIKQIIETASRDIPRGVQTHEETKQLAAELGLTPEKLIMGGVPMSSEHVYAARQLLVESSDLVRSLAQDVVEGNNGDNAREALAKAWVQHVAIQSHVTGVTENNARIQNQFKIAVEGGEQFSNMLKDSIFRNAENIDKLADLVNQYKDNPAALNALTRNSLKPRAEDYVLTLWHNMMLSGISTTKANMAGNALSWIFDIGDKAGGSLIGQATRLSGNGDRVAGREVMSRVYGGVKAFLDGQTYVDAKNAFLTGAQTGHGKFETGHVSLSEPLGLPGHVLETPTNLLSSQDEFWRSIMKASDFHGMSVRQAIKEGLSGQEFNDRVSELNTNPTDDMLIHANDYANDLLFQSKPSWFTQQLQKAKARSIDDSLADRSRQFLTNIIFPYVRVGDNVTTRGLRSSPLGVLSPTNIAAIRGGGAEAHTAIARIAIGSSIAAVIAAKTLSGDVTGNGPDNPAKRAELVSEGVQPNSIKIDGQYYSYLRYDPLSIPISAVANLTEQYKENQVSDKDYTDKASAYVGALASSLSNGNFTQSLGNFLATFQSGPNGDYARKNFASNLASSFTTPALVRDITKMTDPYTRDMSEDGSIGGAIEGRIKGGYPNSDQTLPIKHDVFGRPLLRNPQPEQDPTVLEFKHLSDTLGPEKSLIAPIKRSDLKEFHATSEDLQKYQELAGQNTLEYIRQLQFSPQWGKASDEEKIKEIKSTEADFRKQAREQLFPLYYGPNSFRNSPIAPPQPQPQQPSNTPQYGSFAEAALKQVYPNAEITSNHRNPEDPLSKANPSSDHLGYDALDVRPIPGMSYQDFLKGFNKAGVKVKASKNEVGAGRSPWATGDHWHVVLDTGE